jgi:tetratricopeptide (TPR) repeat protein
LQTPAASNATDPEAAARRARAELTLYQQSADPRYLGRAETALGSYWDEAEPPEPILVLRARIRQSNHEFLPALDDLNRALGSVPNDGQALLDRAGIQTVIGRYDAARADCVRLEPLVAPLYVVVCRAGIAGVTGSAAAAYDELSRALASPRLEKADQCWAESLLGELSSRLGQETRAEQHFRSVLSVCPDDSYARGALADVLLDMKRPAEVVALLADQTRQDALLLRLAIAERAVGASGFDGHLADLSQRFEEAHLRGSSLHRREEARFQLALKDDPERALELALANFQVQREPADVRIALEAALAANKPQAAREVIAFVNTSKLEDPRLRVLLERLRP